jgi:hypothetical protein
VIDTKQNNFIFFHNKRIFICFSTLVININEITCERKQSVTKPLTNEQTNNEIDVARQGVAEA